MFRGPREPDDSSSSFPRCLLVFQTVLDIIQLSLALCFFTLISQNVLMFYLISELLTALIL